MTRLPSGYASHTAFVPTAYTKSAIHMPNPAGIPVLVKISPYTLSYPVNQMKNIPSQCQVYNTPRILNLPGHYSIYNSNYSTDQVQNGSLTDLTKDSSMRNLQNDKKNQNISNPHSYSTYNSQWTNVGQDNGPQMEFSDDNCNRLREVISSNIDQGGKGDCQRNAIKCPTMSSNSVYQPLQMTSVNKMGKDQTFTAHMNSMAHAQTAPQEVKYNNVLFNEKRISVVQSKKREEKELSNFTADIITNNNIAAKKCGIVEKSFNKDEFFKLFQRGNKFEKKNKCKKRAEDLKRQILVGIEQLYNMVVIEQTKTSETPRQQRSESAYIDESYGENIRDIVRKYCTEIENFWSKDCLSKDMSRSLVISSCNDLKNKILKNQESYEMESISNFRELTLSILELSKVLINVADIIKEPHNENFTTIDAFKKWQRHSKGLLEAMIVTYNSMKENNFKAKQFQQSEDSAVVEEQLCHLLNTNNTASNNIIAESIKEKLSDKLRKSIQIPTEASSNRNILSRLSNDKAQDKMYELRNLERSIVLEESSGNKIKNENTREEVTKKMIIDKTALENNYKHKRSNTCQYSENTVKNKLSKTKVEEEESTKNKSLANIFSIRYDSRWPNGQKDLISKTNHSGGIPLISVLHDIFIAVLNYLEDLNRNVADSYIDEMHLTINDFIGYKMVNCNYFDLINFVEDFVKIFDTFLSDRIEKNQNISKETIKMIEKSKFYFTHLVQEKFKGEIPDLYQIVFGNRQ